MVQALINNINDIRDIKASTKTNYMSNVDAKPHLNKTNSNDESTEKFSKCLDKFNKTSSKKADKNTKESEKINADKKTNINNKKNDSEENTITNNTESISSAEENNTKNNQTENSELIAESLNNTDLIDNVIIGNTDIINNELDSSNNDDNDNNNDDGNNENMKLNSETILTGIISSIMPTQNTTSNIKDTKDLEETEINTNNTNSLELINYSNNNNNEGKILIKNESIINLEDLQLEISNEETITKNNNEEEDNNIEEIIIEEDILKELEIESISCETDCNTSSDNDDMMQQQSPQEAGIKAILNSDNNNFSDIKNEIKLEATQTTPKSNNLQTTNPSKIIEQISKQMEGLQNNSKVSIVLNPESLGKVSIQLINTKEGLSAQFTVTNQEARDLIMKGLDSLKDNLLTHGINVDNVSVKMDNTTTDKYNSNWTEQEGSRGGNKEQHQQKQEKNKEEFEQAMSFIEKENGKV